MKVQSFLTGKIYEAEWRTEKQPRTSYAQPVLILKETGEAVDQAFFEILDSYGEILTAKQKP